MRSRSLWWLMPLILVLMAAPAYAQLNRSTQNYSTKITTGNTFQQIRPALSRWSITIQNNNSSDACYLIIGTSLVTAGTTTTSTSVSNHGVTMTAAQIAIVLSAGNSWARYYPYVPNDVIYGTCATTGDSLYVDEQ